MIGTKVRYTGDIANHGGTGKIIEMDESRWGTQVLVELEAEGTSPFFEQNTSVRRMWVDVSQFTGDRPGTRWHYV